MAVAIFLWCAILGSVIVDSPAVCGVELTELDFVLIRDVVNRYEAAYSHKDLKGMVECCDRGAGWFGGLEAEVGREFARYGYISVSSSQMRIVPDPDSTLGNGVMCLNRAFYVAYGDSADTGPVNRMKSAAINEFDAVYVLAKPPEGGPWKIKAWGQALSDAQMEYARARQLLADGKPDEAYGAFRRLIETDPSYSAAYSSLSDLSFAMGKIDEALSCAEKAAGLRPDCAYYQYSLGRIYLYIKDRGRAMAALMKARYLDPGFPGIGYHLYYAERLMGSPGAMIRPGTVNEKARGALAAKSRIAGDSLVLGALNLVVRKPKGWQFIQTPDWRVVAAMSPKAVPGATDAFAGVAVKAISGNEGPADLNERAAQDLAGAFGKKEAIRLGRGRNAKIAGKAALEERFAFIIGDVQVIAAIATFIKDKISYTIAYSARSVGRDDMRFDSRPYGELIKGISFIDPRRDMDASTRRALEEAETLDTGRHSADMSPGRESRDAWSDVEERPFF